MKTPILKTLLFFSFFMFFVPNLLSAQEVIGKIFTKAEADQMFGPVLKKFDIDVNAVKALLDQAGDYVMFNYDSDDLYIANGKKKVIFNYGQMKNSFPTEIFRKFSVSVVRDLLSRGSEDKVHIEKRADVVTLTYAESTMDMAKLCPPNCF
ncbi:MAG: hypothetical protein HF300_13645 [Ignavibacteria bacterium]|nr:hypothetical protein [Ignavibacteria bacterium]MCU7499195.1 hypothetical protein [Ignavibacteria bacterium]MCU7513602.1 hypothetical protein [Ignavibacteria bacterium]MCU7520128.1 hypothetical protein [Ignavibacteria bacterium]MCU7525718.1 hypothetical protein [Ignavibacteria bacterium]